jgi:LacI family transcriptional regulator
MAGVSLKTVSRVVNAEAGVSGKLDSRVRAAIDRLDYRPDLSASSLRRTDRKTGTIGLLCKDLADPSSSTVHRAVVDIALRRGVFVIAGSTDNNEARERELIAAFSSRRVDGLIILTASHDQSQLVIEQRRGTAMVFVDRDPAGLDADSVMTDGQAGVCLALSHLVARGHSEIGYLGDLQGSATAALRYQIHWQELNAQGLDVDTRLVKLDLHGVQSAEVAAIELLTQAQPPSALFAATNLLAIGAHRALRKLHLQDRVALIAFDDVLMVDLLQAGVTVIARDAATLGRAAAELLFRRIDGDRSPSRRLAFPPLLVTRGSGEVKGLN